MFMREPDASKAALITLARFLRDHGFAVMDAQQRTPHVERMGGREISRDEFLRIMARDAALPGIRGSWSGLLV
jgi:leucyl/phenylalanyl-tRNA--protein transferase